MVLDGCFAARPWLLFPACSEHPGACVLQGLDGFWRWVLEGLHAGAPDLFPGTGLPGDASGFEEAFSAVGLPLRCCADQTTVRGNTKKRMSLLSGPAVRRCLPHRQSASYLAKRWRHCMPSEWQACTSFECGVT